MRLFLLVSRTGTVVTILSTCGDADDVFFDAQRHRLYVSGEVITVVQESVGSYRTLARIKLFRVLERRCSCQSSIFYLSRSGSARSASRLPFWFTGRCPNPERSKIPANNDCEGRDIRPSLPD